MQSLPLSALLVVTLLATVAGPWAHAAAQGTAPDRPVPLKVFLDCESCHADFLRAEIAFVDHVRDRTGADVHVLVTRAQTGSGGTEHTVAMIGLRHLDGVIETLRTLTASSDTDDIVRRQLATTIRAGLLRFLTRDGVPPGLDVAVTAAADGGTPTLTDDRWDGWVFSLRVAAALEGEQSSRERQLGASVSADRITPDWKVSFGVELDHEREEFDLDEDEPVVAIRRELDVDALIVKGLGEHWSVGARAEAESSTFDNVALAIGAAPAVEYNVFPYSMYTRRQLRAGYQLGAVQSRYYQETLYGRTRETRPRHELSLAWEQRERWGSLETRVEWSQYLHDLARNRLEVEGEFAVRLARGLSVASTVRASRIRDQLSLPARGATDEEVLLRLRQLESGYEYEFAVSLTYTFGSIFSSIVNPRFGQ